MTDRLEALERLARLRDTGVLSASEFEAEKVRILQSDETVRKELPPASLAASAGVLDRVAGQLGRKHWIVAGLGIALLAGAVLAYAVWSDVRTASQSDGNQQVARAPDVPVNLSSVLRFRDTEACTPGEGLQDILRLMTAARGVANPAADAPIRVAGFEEALVPRVGSQAGEEGSPVIVEIDLPGTWKGLHVMRLHTASWGSDDVSSLQVHFREPAEEARDLLRQLGFSLGPVGELKAAGDALVGVEAIDGGSALTCVRDARSSRKSSAEE